MPADRHSGRRPGRPPKFERAPTAFGRWLDASGMTVEHFAAKVGIGVRSAYRLRSGEQIPPLEVAERIIDLADGKLDIRSFRAD